MIQFVSNYIAGNKQICCINILGSDAAITQPGFSELVKLPICCNSFSKGYVDSLLLSMETWYDKDNPIHEEMCMNYPYNTIISNGIAEYSLFNGDSAIYDFITAANLLPTDSFKFIFLMYIVMQGIVITCSHCAQENNTINIMTTANFINNCLGS